MVEWLKTIILCSSGFALLFGLVSLVFYFGDWIRLIFTTVMGLFVGVVAAPEIAPKQFKRAWLLQSCAGIGFGLALGLGFEFDVEMVMASMLAFGIIGWGTPFWLKHMPIP